MRFIKSINLYDLQTDLYECKNFFLGFRYGKCIRTPAGINKIGGIPKEIAEFVKLEYPKKYIGHALRRSSDTTAANAGSTIEEIQDLGGCKKLQNII